VLYALAAPTSFALLLAGFLVAVALHGWVQALAAVRAGEGAPRAEQRLRPDPRRHIDPFGLLGAAVSGTGWARQTELTRRRGAAGQAPVLLSGTVANLALGLALLVGYRLAGGPPVDGTLLALQRGVQGLDLALLALYLVGLSNVAVGLLSLVPVPPLPGGRLLLAAGPTTRGWQQARYRLVDQNIGTAVLLALLLIPLGGPQPLLPTVLDQLLVPALRPVLGG
jgi:Zn-dependent protease